MTDQSKSINKTKEEGKKQKTNRSYQKHSVHNITGKHEKNRKGIKSDSTVTALMIPKQAREDFGERPLGICSQMNLQIQILMLTKNTM